MIIPQPGYVVVEPIGEEKIGGFIASQDNLEKQQKSKVVAVGDECINEWGTLIKTNVKVNDIVIHRSWGHESIQLDGHEYRVCRFLDIVAVIK